MFIAAHGKQMKTSFSGFQGCEVTNYLVYANVSQNICATVFEYHA